MKPELILHADVLDILFENRNKEYGAYELRRHYDNRLIKSLTIIFLILIAAISISFIKNYFFPNSITHIIDVTIPDTKIASVDIKPREIPKIKPLQQRQIAQQIFTKPFITTKEIINPPPTQKDLETKIISTRNINGDNLKPSDAIVPNADSKGNGNEVKEAEPEKEIIIDRAEFMPEFPGGLSALQHFLSRNLKTPKNDMEAGSKIKVQVKFVVDKDGTITGINVEQSGGQIFDNEVIRVMKKMPAWKPGMQNGKNVAVYFTIPVVFQSADDN